MFQSHEMTDFDIVCNLKFINLNVKNINMPGFI